MNKGQVRFIEKAVDEILFRLVRSRKGLERDELLNTRTKEG